MLMRQLRLCMLMILQSKLMSSQLYQRKQLSMQHFSQALNQQQQEDMLIQLLILKIQENMLLQRLRCFIQRERIDLIKSMERSDIEGRQYEED